MPRPQIYEEDFETAFLDTTRNFYHGESMDFIANNTCPDFLTKVCRPKLQQARCSLSPAILVQAEARLSEESSRVKHYLHPLTEIKLKNIVETELIYNHAKALVEMENSGCVAMLHDDKVARTVGLLC